MIAGTCIKNGNFLTLQPFKNTYIMKLDGRRTSSNVSDRRGVSGKTLGVGGGIVGVIVAAVITLLSGEIGRASCRERVCQYV